MKQDLEAIINDYVFDPVLQQELLVDFLLVCLDFRPAFFLEDRQCQWKSDFDFMDNPEFIQRIEELGFMVVIGPFYDNDEKVAVIINPKHSKMIFKKLDQIRSLGIDNPRKHTLIGQVLGYNCAGYDYLNYSYSKLVVSFVFIRNGIETTHLGVWCPPDSLEEQIPNMVARLSGMFQSHDFKDFKIELRYSFKTFGQ